MNYTIRDGVCVEYEGRTPTAQEAADALAHAAAQEAAEAAIAAIYAPVEINGKLYPADLNSLAKYEVAKQARGRGALAKGIVVALDGSVTKLTGQAAIDDFHLAIESAVTARIEAAHDAL